MYPLICLLYFLNIINVCTRCVCFTRGLVVPIFIYLNPSIYFRAQDLIMKIICNCGLHLGLVWNISHFFFQFGLTALTALPGFITSSVHSVLFSLLAHPQLSIREHATKALSAILSRCEFEVRQSLQNMYMMDCMIYRLTKWIYSNVVHKLGSNE